MSTSVPKPVTASENLIEVNIVASGSQLPAQRQTPITLYGYVNNPFEVRGALHLIASERRYPIRAQCTYEETKLKDDVLASPRLLLTAFAEPADIVCRH